MRRHMQQSFDKRAKKYETFKTITSLAGHNDCMVASAV